MVQIRIKMRSGVIFCVKIMKANLSLCFMSAGSRKKKSDLRIILVGKTGAGKSTAGNTILGREEFKSQQSSSSETSECRRGTGEVRGQKVAIVDTPGLFDTDFTQDEVLERIESCVSLSAPSPHAFLVVVKLDRFTQEEKDTVRIIQSTFGEKAAKHSLVLFTHGDRLKTQSIERFVSKTEELKGLILQCYGRYHVFNNQVKDQEQVNQLLEKIDRMTLENDGGYYTAQMFKKAKKVLKKEKMRLSKELKAEEQQRRKTMKAQVEREMRLKGRSKKHKCVMQ